MKPLTHRLKLHSTRAQRDAGLALCGRTVGGANVSELAGDVSCKQCQQEQRYLQRIVTKVTVDSVTAELPPAPVPLIRGTHKIDARIAKIIARSIDGDDETRRKWTWPSAVIALATLVWFRAEGQPVRSTSAPSRFEKEPLGRTDASRAVTALADRIVHVDRALAMAYPGERVFEASVDEDGKERARAVLDDNRQQMLLTHSCAGARDPKSGYRTFQGVSHALVAEWFERSTGIDLTERQVQLVRDAGLRAVAARLRAIGELEPAEEETRPVRAEGSKVPLPGMDVEGWGEISAVVGYSVSTCQKLASRVEDPLPRYVFKGVAGVHAKREELLRWVERQISRAS